MKQEQHVTVAWYTSYALCTSYAHCAFIMCKSEYQSCVKCMHFKVPSSLASTCKTNLFACDFTYHTEHMSEPEIFRMSRCLLRVSF